MNIDQVKKQTEEFARTSFSSETFPHGVAFQEDGAVQMHALALRPIEALRTLGQTPCFAAAFMIEAWGVNREDIIAITIDHPDGVVFGRIEVDNESEQRLGAIRWTNELVPSLPGERLEFPRLTPTGRFVSLRLRKVTP